MLFRIILFLLTVFLTVPSATAQGDVSTCQVGHDELFIRHNPNSAQLMLVSWHTGDVVETLRENFMPDQFYLLSWSPDCSSFIFYWQDDGEAVIEAWRTSPVTMVGMLEGSPLHREHWSPDDHTFILQTEQGGYLWNLATNISVLLTTVVDSYGRSFYSTEWDTSRNQLLAVQMDDLRAVRAYDISTGQHVARYHLVGAGPVTFRHSTDNKYLVLTSEDEENMGDTSSVAVAMWDRDSLAHIQFSIPLTDGGERKFIDDHFQIEGNLESGYLVVNHETAALTPFLGVWDLHNLTGNAPHRPNYHLRAVAYRPRRWRFVLPDVFEYVEFDGYPGSLSVSLYRLNLVSGEEISWRPSIEVCRNPRQFGDSPDEDVLEWACMKADELLFPYPLKYQRLRLSEFGYSNIHKWVRRSS